VTQDQRGVSRPQGSACDVGAYEAAFGASFFTLTVTLAGTGTGTVTSNPTGINCPGDCSESLPREYSCHADSDAGKREHLCGLERGLFGKPPDDDRQDERQ
jgi:hypothetical protein